MKLIKNFILYKLPYRTTAARPARSRRAGGGPQQLEAGTAGPPLHDGPAAPAGVMPEQAAASDQEPKTNIVLYKVSPYHKCTNIPKIFFFPTYVSFTLGLIMHY